MENPLILPENKKSELQKFELHYEHVPEKAQERSRNKQVIPK